MRDMIIVMLTEYGVSEEEVKMIMNAYNNNDKEEMVHAFIKTLQRFRVNELVGNLKLYGATDKLAETVINCLEEDLDSLYEIIMQLNNEGANVELIESIKQLILTAKLIRI